MKRRLFVIGLMAMPASAALATSHDPIDTRLKNLREPDSETSQNTILSNVSFIAMNASKMNKAQLVRSYAYLIKVFKMQGLSSTLNSAVVEAMVAVEKAWLGGEHGTLDDLNKAASEMLRENPPPFIAAAPKKEP